MRLLARGIDFRVHCTIFNIKRQQLSLFPSNKTCRRYWTHLIWFNRKKNYIIWFIIEIKQKEENLTFYDKLFGSENKLKWIFQNLFWAINFVSENQVKVFQVPLHLKYKEKEKFETKGENRNTSYKY